MLEIFFSFIYFFFLTSKQHTHSGGRRRDTKLRPLNLTKRLSYLFVCASECVCLGVFEEEKKRKERKK